LSKIYVACVAVLLFFVTENASAQDAKLALALNNVQSEMSDCLAYYANIKACVGTQDKELSEGTQKTLDALTSMAVKVGQSAGMTLDAMMSRLAMFQNEQRELIKGNCSNMSSLFTRHAARCKKVVQNGDAILDEYLKR
jgi:molybdopterin converting factor small subunit